jgi:hypothetical protein
MSLLRRRLRFVAAAWILFQAATLSALVPRACCLAHEAASANPSTNCHDKAPVPHCATPDDNVSQCAMREGHGHAHHAARSDKQPASHECALRGTCNGPAAALFALLSTHGVLTDTGSTQAEFPLSGAPLSSTERLIPQFASPDAPPPRA